MLSLQRTLSVGYLMQHPTRMLLVVLSIALGVGTLVATRSLDDSLHRAAKGAINPFATLADLLVSNGQTGVPADLADRLKDARLPGLGDVQPLVMGRASLVELDDQSVRLLGVNLPEDMLSRKAGAAAGENPWGLALEPASLEEQAAAWQGVWFSHEKWVLVGAPLAERLNALPNGGRHFSLRRGPGDVQRMANFGSVHLEGAAKVLEEEGVFTDVGTAASIVYPQRKDYCTQLNLKLAPGADHERVRQEVAQFLKDHNEPAQVQTVEANEEMASDVTAGLELGFSIGGYLALLVGLFLVYNVLSVSVAERRHDIGILRSVGATRGQIARLFVGEAAVLGLVGSLVGLPLGYVMAWVALGPMHRVLSEVFLKLPEATVSVSPPAMLFAVGAGMAATLLASLAPALSAADEQPADAVRRVPQTVRPLYFALQTGGAILLAAAGVAACVGRAHLPPRFGVFIAPVCLFAAILVAMPLLAAGVGRVLNPAFRLCLGLCGRLAADNLVRAPRRTGLVIAALAATTGLLLGTAGFTHSSERALADWIDDNIAADLFVTAGSSVATPGVSLPMDESVGRELERMPPVEAALPVRFHYFSYHGQFVYLVAVDLDAFPPGARDRAMARDLGRYPRLREPRTCLVSENFAALHGVRVGDRVSIPGRSAPTIDLEVVGSVVDYTSNRGSLVVDRKWFRQEFADDQVDVFDVYLRPGADVRQVQDDLTKPGGWASHEALFVARRDELRDAVTGQLERIYHLAYAQEFVVGLVALLGVISAMFISVLQRRRELGLLRAVGASQGQVLRSVLAEACLMGVVGAVIGFAGGLLLERYILQIVVFDEAGVVFPMLVPWATTACVVGGSVLLATVVGLWPAWRATRLRIPEAIAYE